MRTSWLTSAPPSPGATKVSEYPVSASKSARSSSLRAKESWVTTVSSPPPVLPPAGSSRSPAVRLQPARARPTAPTVAAVRRVVAVRVVQAVDFVHDDSDYAGTMTMTWEVTATDGGTRVDIRADDVPAGISAEDHAAGLASSLANLAAYVGDPP